jgi:hypothetical protein
MRRLSGPTVALVLVSIAGLALVLFATRTGPAVRGDSVRYVMGARNLLAGNGFSRLSGGGEVFPETGFAPMLSFVLAAFGLVGLDMYAGARFLNALLFGGSLFLVGLLIATASRSRWLGVLGALLVVVAPNVVRWHTWLMSEPLFIFLTLLSVFAWVTHIRTGRSAPLFIGAVAAGLAGLTRYVGVSLVPAGALGILLWGGGSRRDRLVRAIEFALVAALPFALWMVRNEEVGGAGLANRQLRFHAFRPDALRVFLFEPTTWVIPVSLVLPRTVRGALAVVALAVGPAVLLLRALRRRSITGPGETRGEAVLPFLLLLLVPCYVGILAFNSLFLDAGTTLDGILRYLTPLFVLLVILELTAYAAIFPSGRGRWPALLIPATWLAVSLTTNTVQTWSFARASTATMGFTGIRTEWLDLAFELRPAPTIITDNPEMVYYLIDRPAYMLPIKFDQYQLLFRTDYQEQLDLARDRLRGGAILVVFGAPSAEEAEVIDLLDVTPIRTFDGATVYGVLS